MRLWTEGIFSIQYNTDIFLGLEPEGNNSYFAFDEGGFQVKFRNF